MKNFKQPNFTPQELEKEEKQKHKVSRRKDITKMETQHTKTYEIQQKHCKEESLQ